MGNPKLVEADHDVESGSAPPPYFPLNQSTTNRQSNEPEFLPPDDSSPGQNTVLVDECIAHLKLLSAIANLRRIVSRTDNLFGIRDSEAKEFSDPRKQAQAAACIQEKRWAVYVARAVDRFTSWWESCIPSLETRDIASLGTSSRARIGWSVTMMPPLGE